MKITKQLSPEPEGSNGVANNTETVVENNGAAEQTTQEKNFGPLVDAFKESTEAAAKEQETPKTEEVVSEETKTEPVLDAVEQEAKRKADEATAIETAKVEKEKADKELAAKSEEVFKIPGEENTPPTTWEALKSELKLDVKEEKPEAYKEAISKLIADKAEETRSQTLDKLIEKEPIEIQEAYLFAKHGEAKAINENLATISTLKSMDNVSLIEQDMKLKGFDPEAIETKLAKLTEDNQIDATAAPLRQLLNEAETATLADKTAFVNSLREKQQNSAIQEKENLANGTSDYFKTFKEFMGIPVNDVTKDRMQQYIVNGIKEGKYSNVLSPAELAEWRLYKEFGSQAVSNLKTNSFAQGRDTKTKDLHNVPLKQTGINSQAANKVKSDSPFANLQSEFGAIN